METKLIDTTNVTNQDDLYSALVEAVQPLIDEHERKVAPLTKQYENDVAEFNNQYLKSIEPAEKKAIAALTPARNKLNADVKAIEEVAKKKVDVVVAKYMKHKDTIQGHFEKNTVKQKAILDQQCAPFKSRYDADLKVLVDQVDAAILPVNAEYNELAAAMDKSQAQLNKMEPV